MQTADRYEGPSERDGQMGIEREGGRKTVTIDGGAEMLIKNVESSPKEMEPGDGADRTIYIRRVYPPDRPNRPDSPDLPIRRSGDLSALIARS